MLKFRDLRADEIECRVSTISDKGLSLLLYKDARCDMNILDETVGPLGWQRYHSRENANCIVSIWDEKNQTWVSKEDTGKESYSEKEKGLASDSFKRACFNWGIGRELYTAPFIWIPKGMYTESRNKNGAPTTYDRFVVTRLECKDKKITRLEIKNSKTGKVVFSAGGATREAPGKKETNKLADSYVKSIVSLAEKKNVGLNQVYKMYGKTDLHDLTIEEYRDCMTKLEACS